MAKNKVSDWSATPANNTDIGDINIAEGCAPSNINNAIRELMAQVKDMQTGADADNFVIGGALTCSGNAVFSGSVSIPTTPLGVTSGGTGLSTLTSGDVLYASATNTLSKLAGAATTTSVLLSGNPAPSWGKVALASAVSGTLPIANGGTGQTTATAATNALLPSQTGNSGKYLTTNGTDTSWATVSGGGGSVTSVASGAGMNFTTITGTGTVTMGTPGTLTTSTTNSASGTTHTHAVTFPNTITSVNGTSSGAVTISATVNANASYGGIGTYAFLAIVNTAGIVEDSTYSGADLRPAGIHTASTTFQNDTTASCDLTNGSTAPSGTWRAMGRSNASASTRYRATLFLRIS